MKIIQDTREKCPLKFSPKIQVVKQKLETGDYSLLGHEDQLCIERKNLSDLYTSLFTQRFSRVIERMQGYPYRFLVIEATYEQVLEKMDWYLQKASKRTGVAVIGKLFSLQTKSNIHVAFVEKKRAAHYVESLCGYYWRNLKGET